MLKFISGASCALILGMLLTTGANATTIITSQNFDTVTTGPTGDGVWYVDRTAPLNFETRMFEGDNRLALDIDITNTNRTQGRKYNVTGADTISIDMYIDTAFNTNDTTRYGGMWGTAVNADNDISYYAIIEFFDNQFKIYDSDSVLGGWIDIGTPVGFTPGGFVNLKIALDTLNDEFTYYIGGEALYTFGAGGSVSFSNVILQGIQNGVPSTVYFDNFLATVVPVPPALPLFATGIALMGFMGWRRKRKIAA